VFKTVEERQNAGVKKEGEGFLDTESLDGQTRFKIGLIDFLTKYDSFKYIEN
jgi:hypothetical protein